MRNCSPSCLASSSNWNWNWMHWIVEINHVYDRMIIRLFWSVWLIKSENDAITECTAPNWSWNQIYRLQSWMHRVTKERSSSGMEAEKPKRNCPIREIYFIMNAQSEISGHWIATIREKLKTNRLLTAATFCSDSLFWKLITVFFCRGLRTKKRNHRFQLHFSAQKNCWNYRNCYAHFFSCRKLDGKRELVTFFFILLQQSANVHFK